MDKLGELLPKVLAEKGLAGAAKKGRLVYSFDEYCKERWGEKRGVWGMFVRGKTLYAGVKDSAWGQKVYFEKTEILAELEKKFGGEVEDVRTKVGGDD